MKIETVDQLREVVGHPNPATEQKKSSSLTNDAIEFIGKSPLLLLATTSENGAMDVSPKGDAPGFVEIDEQNNLLIPDRRGNRLVDGHLGTPSIRSLMGTPGFSSLSALFSASIARISMMRARCLSAARSSMRAERSSCSRRCLLASCIIMPMMSRVLFPCVWGVRSA